MRAAQAIWRFLSHPVLSAAGNLSLLVTTGPFVVAAMAAVAGRFLDQPVLFLVAIGLAVFGLALAALNAWRQHSSGRLSKSEPSPPAQQGDRLPANARQRERGAIDRDRLRGTLGESEAQSETRPLTYGDLASMRVPLDEPDAAESQVPASQRRGRVYGGAAVGEVARRLHAQTEEKAVFIAVENEIALAHEEALEMAKILRAGWPHLTPDGAVVQVVLPDWRAKTTEFIGAVLGSAYRAAFKGAAKGESVLERLESEGQFLSDLAVKLTPDFIRVNQEEVLSAREKRRGHEAASFLNYDHSRMPGAPEKSSNGTGSDSDRATPHPVPLGGQLDSLMREGMSQLESLSAAPMNGSNPLQPDPQRMSVGNDLEERLKDLLTPSRPSLLTIYAEAANVAERRDHAAAPSAPADANHRETLLYACQEMHRRPEIRLTGVIEGIAAVRNHLDTASSI